jgi:hypothetical protein
MSGYLGIPNCDCCGLVRHLTLVADNASFFNANSGGLVGVEAIG